jgi:hypothetical protein
VEGKLKWGALGVIGGGAASQIVPVMTILTDKTPTEIADKWNVWWPIISYGLPFVFAILAIIAVGLLTTAAYRRGKRDGIALARNPAPQLVAAVSAVLPAAEQQIGTTAREPARSPIETDVVGRDHVAVHQQGSLDTFEIPKTITPSSLVEHQEHSLSSGASISSENPWVSSAGIDLDGLQYAIKEIVTALAETGHCRVEILKRNTIVLEAEHPAWHVDGPYDLRARFLKASRDALDAREVKGSSVFPVIADYPAESREKHVQKVKTKGNMLRDELRKLPRTVSARNT